MHRSLATSLAALAFTAPLTNAQSVVVVDDDVAGPDALQIAIDENPGSVLLVKAGTYREISVPFISPGRWIVAVEPGVEVLGGSILNVGPLPFIGANVLHGMTFRDTPETGGQPALYIDGAVEGYAWLQDLHLEAETASPVGGPSAVLYTLRSLFLIGSTVVSNRIGGSAFEPVFLTSFVFDSELEGGAGGGALPPGSAIGPFYGANGAVIAFGSELVGGAGAAGSAPGSDCTDGQDGAPGATEVTLLLTDTQSIGGAGGSATAPCAPGTQGPPLDTNVVVTERSTVGGPRRVTGDGFVLSGSTGRLEFEGAPGEFVVLAVSGPTSAGVLTFEDEFFLPLGPLPPTLLLGGVLDANGQGALDYSATLPAGVSFVPLILQSAFVGSPDGVVTGTPRAVALVDATL